MENINKKATKLYNKPESEILTKQITPQHVDTLDMTETINKNDCENESLTKEISNKQPDVDESKEESEQEEATGCSEPNCDKDNCILNALRCDDKDTALKFLQMTFVLK